jgi:hypothetical protein
LELDGVQCAVVCGVFFSVEKIDDKELFMTNEDPPFESQPCGGKPIF